MDEYEVNEHRIDLRMEFEQTWINIRAIVNSYWIGFGAFFAVNTILVTMYGSSFFLENNLEYSFTLSIVRSVVATTGMVIAIFAIIVALQLSRLQTKMFHRLSVIEEILCSSSYQAIKAENKNNSKLTVIGASCFFAIWTCAFAIAWRID